MDNHRMTPEEAAKLLPAGAALSWGLVKPPQRGPKREMSIDQIVQKAMEIADRDGLAAVSMSRVASEFGFTAMSLYRYIPSKDDLLLLMQDAACDIQLPPERGPQEWREGLREYVEGTIAIFRRHPWYGDIPIFSVPISPNNLRIVDWALRPMKDLPLGDHEKMSIVLLLSGYARNCGMIQRDMDRAILTGSSAEAFSGQSYTEALQVLVKRDQFPNLHPIVISGAYTEEDGDNPIGNDVDFGLERILDGIEVYLDRKKSAGAHR